MTKYTPISEATVKSHIYAQWYIICSTKKAPLNKNMGTTISIPIPIHGISKSKELYDVISRYETVTNTLTTSSPSSFSSYKETPGLHTHYTYVDCRSITGKISTDQKVWFVIPSVSGKNYLLIIFYIYINSIFAKPIPNRNEHSIKNAYAKILNILKNRRLKPQLRRLDNEASDILK